ncbi:hypothetical protein JCM24511_08566 [Saitozyma sp. JCM 24511]|nr:hypothetical protein JCM24511_08566 [Saitozyma sp. JCM 24511]
MLRHGLRLGLLWLALNLVTPTLALSEFACLQIVQRFANQFLAPTQIDDARALFANDVVGVIDVAGSLQGREAAAEYLFGPFAGVAEQPDVPNLLGLPVGYNVTALIVEHTTLAATIQLDLYYKTLNQTFPVEIGGWFVLNDQGEISQFDLTFRRWAWAMDTIVPQLVPQMATLVGSQRSNATLTLQQYLGMAICLASQSSCNGTNQQYSSFAACESFVSTLPVGSWDQLGDNNLACRALHVPLLQYNTSNYCAAIGQSGGDFCTTRDYLTTVEHPQFTQSFLAPKFVTPENKNLVGDMSVTNGTTISPLVDLELSLTGMHSWDPTLYATFTFVYFLFLWCCGQMTWAAFRRLSPTFRSVPKSHQRNIVMYSLNIFFTLVALGLELAGARMMSGDYELYHFQCVRMSGVVIVGLYTFELIFRFDMRPPLIAHHFCTIAVISYGACVMEYTQSPAIGSTAIIWLFQATTEQATFVGLLGYRMRWDPRKTSLLLKIAALQTLVVKCASAVGVLVSWGVTERQYHGPVSIGWSVIVWTLSVGLLATQFWGSYVTYMIGVRLDRKLADPSGDDVAPSRAVSRKTDIESEGGNGNAYGGVPTLLERDPAGYRDDTPMSEKSNDIDSSFTRVSPGSVAKKHGSKGSQSPGSSFAERSSSLSWLVTESPEGEAE